jgi:hypothetical protein
MAKGAQYHTPAALPLVKTRYHLYRRLGGPQGQSVWLWKISLPLGFDPQTVHPIASPYINHVTPKK